MIVWNSFLNSQWYLIHEASSFVEQRWPAALGGGGSILLLVMEVSACKY